MDRELAKEFIAKSEHEAQSIMQMIDDTAMQNQEKVLNAFNRHRITYRHFVPTTGYGYDDVGRDTLNRMFADIMGGEDGLVSPLIVNGTHALTLALFGVLRPNDLLVSITGKPYDTLDDVINGSGNGSLRDFGILYEECATNSDGSLIVNEAKAILAKQPKVVFIQRSKGYLWREAYSIAKLQEIIMFVRNNTQNKPIILVDNCYGEFTETQEPTDVGADLIVGSFIKNPGGGIAPTGGYIVGRKDLIHRVANRMTAPSLGNEVGSYEGGYRLFYQGLFLAPSTVKNTLRGNALASIVFSKMGYRTMPERGKRPLDIINSIHFDTSDELIRFCQTVQSVSPIDSFVTPEAWDMPGYSHPVIMAAGTFVQGASLELTADGTVREPYVAYMQGGLTYEHCKLALIRLVETLI